MAGQAATILRQLDVDQSGSICFAELLTCIYPNSRPGERTAIAEWCLAATSGSAPSPAARRELRPLDLLSDEQRESLTDSFEAACVSGNGLLTQLELAQCVPRPPPPPPLLRQCDRLYAPTVIVWLKTFHKNSPPPPSRYASPSPARRLPLRPPPVMPACNIAYARFLWAPAACCYACLSRPSP